MCLMKKGIYGSREVNNRENDMQKIACHFYKSSRFIKSKKAFDKTLICTIIVITCVLTPVMTIYVRRRFV